MGCQMNVDDSNSMASHLERLGFSFTNSKEEADFIVLNTCSVREHAEHKAMSFIGRLKPLKDANPNLKIVVTGCAAERLGQKLRKKFPIIDLVIGAKQIENFPEIFDKSFSLAHSDNCGEAPSRMLLPSRAKESDEIAFVTIMRGCHNFCSYCIVPYVRGPEKSRAVADVLADIKTYAAGGFKDVMLLGQNVNSYCGAASDGTAIDFPDLLAEVNKIPGIERIRFMTSHPKDLSDKLIEAMATLDKVCAHLHLPLQSGSDKILEAMNRKYDTALYIALIKKIRRRIADICITTDILVGFPGETENDFSDTLLLIEKAGFNALFAFKYSPREGTASSGLAETITEEEKDARLKRVLELADKISISKNNALVGSVVQVLVENTEGPMCTGRTRSNIKVFFPAPTDKNMNGSMVDVTITRAKVNTLVGEPCAK